MKSFRELNAWRSAMELALAVYRETADLPASEKYGLQSQIRRASVSVPANIAEGYGRNNRPEYVNFLGIASGSLAETDTLLELAEQLGYLTRSEELLETITTTSKLLRALIASLRVPKNVNR